MPYYGVRPEQRLLEKLYYAFPAGAFCGPVYRWLRLAGFPGMAGEPDFIDLSELGLAQDGVLYLDYCHYTGRFADAIAAAMAEPVLSRL